MVMLSAPRHCRVPGQDSVKVTQPMKDHMAQPDSTPSLLCAGQGPCEGDTADGGTRGAA